MNCGDNVSYLIGALKQFNNGLSGLSSDIGISVKTLNDFLEGNASVKTIKLVERYLMQKMGAISSLMESYHSSVLEKIVIHNGTTVTDIIIPHNKLDGGLEVEFKWKGERGGEVNAEGVYFGEKQFVIKKGSTCTHTKRLELLHHKKGNNLRRKVTTLLKGKNPYLKQIGIRSYELIRDYETSSASAAISILRGYSENGNNTRIVKGTDQTINEYFGN